MLLLFCLWHFLDKVLLFCQKKIIKLIKTNLKLQTNCKLQLQTANCNCKPIEFLSKQYFVNIYSFLHVKVFLHPCKFEMLTVKPGFNTTFLHSLKPGFNTIFLNELLHKYFLDLLRRFFCLVNV